MLIDMMSQVSGELPVLWGADVIGFGAYHHKYASGREGDWMKIGFSPRKAAFSLYFNCGLDKLTDEIEELGTLTHGKGCIYIKKLADIDIDMLQRMATKAYQLSNDFGHVDQESQETGLYTKGPL